jgi:hypothetical protein
MNHEALARLLHEIGGSAKRREEGQTLGITASGDPDLTPGGRLLIGKIGIGLFSIRQLSRRFKIVTKVAGEKYRLIAEVQLRTYSEDGAEDSIREDDDSFVSGEVFITRELISDVKAHGTDIILDDVKPRVRDLLRSADRWHLLEAKAKAEKESDADSRFVQEDGSGGRCGRRGG